MLKNKHIKSHYLLNYSISVIHNWNILDFIEHEMGAYDDLRECLLINRTKIQEMLCELKVVIRIYSIYKFN